MLTGIQVRMARAGLSWTADKLAEVAGVGVSTVLSFEGGGGVRSGTIQKLEEALKGAGVSLLEDDGTGQGVRVR